MMQIRPEVLKKLREDYSPGARVELIEMCDPYRDMPSGMHGKAMFVDDAGGVNIALANGSTPAAIRCIDVIRRTD